MLHLPKLNIEDVWGPFRKTHTHTHTDTRGEDVGARRAAARWPLPDSDNGFLILVKGREAMVGTRAADNLKEKKVVTERQDTEQRQPRQAHVGRGGRGVDGRKKKEGPHRDGWRSRKDALWGRQALLPSSRFALQILDPTCGCFFFMFVSHNDHHHYY